MSIARGTYVVVGLARSGVGAANLLAGLGMEVTATDARTEAALGPALARLRPEVKLALGGHPAGLFDGSATVVISPGVRRDAAFLRAAGAAGAEVIGELELAWRFTDGRVPFHAVTGTNGKSTTVSMLQAMMLADGRRSLLGGNIGLSLCEAFASDPEGVGHLDCVVAEVSSFQLESVGRFHARGAAVLNVTPDHLDRYPSYEAYRDTKARIAQHQGAGDALVLNADDPECGAVERASGAPDVYYFSRSRAVRGAYLRDGQIRFDSGSGEKDILDVAAMGVLGSHNEENALAATALALLGGCTAEAVARALRAYRGLPHRMEVVREIGGVRYINDSKGTNVAATLKSLEGFTAPVVLIAGGRDKAGEFGPLADALGRTGRGAILIGEAADKIEAAVAGSVPCVRAADMDEAVRKAAAMAHAGDTVLLSPACASFDMFDDFEHRGREFARAVGEL